MDRTTDAQIPRLLPVLPGLALAGHYGLTDREPRHRGDTLDATALPQGRVGLMVADVVGHGLEASLAAAQVRAVLWSLLCEGATLLAALESLDRHAERNRELVGTAVGVAVLDLETGRLEYAAAGLLPPLVLPLISTPVLLEATPTHPLGTRGAMRVHRTQLRPDDMVVMSTNGLPTAPAPSLSRARRDLVSRAARALDGATARGSSPAERADHVGRSMVSPHAAAEMRDDVAVLVAQRMPVPRGFTLRRDAATLDITELRGRVCRWLDGLGAGLADHIGLSHVLVELATNVVDHAYRGSDRPGEGASGHGGRPLQIDATLDETGAVLATVSDRGRWRDRVDAAGRGLSMAAGLVDSLRVRRSPEGTDVELSCRLGRPVKLWQVEPDPAGSRPAPPRGELSAVADAGLLTASGPVDAASADLFHAALVEVTRGGTTAATVDLTGVTHLASPGVQSLFDLSDRSARSGVRMKIVASDSSPARQILDVVGLAAGP